jgi:hypothetical protein
MFVPGLATMAGESGVEGKQKFTRHFKQSLFRVTEHAFYSMEVLLDDKEYNIGKNAIGIIVHNALDEDVKGAELVIAHRNVSTGENAPGRVTVVDKGNGLYIISGLDLGRKGRWELMVTVRKDGIEDNVKFALK